ncbi:hypothetical protein HAX54_018208, partial [Datura stramonium]|nr:hypothetical protein [Datura stramonium]
DFGLIEDLMDRRSHEGPSLVPLEGDCGRLHWFRVTTQMTNHQECDSPLWVPSGCLVVEILPDSQGKFCNLPCY